MFCSMYKKNIFHADISALESGKEQACSSKLKELNPFLNNGLLLIGGRLENANIPKEQKHPIILPSDHMLHCGLQLLLADIRRVYWPVRGRVAARFTIRRYVVFKRSNLTFDQPIIAALY